MAQSDVSSCPYHTCTSLALACFVVVDCCREGGETMDLQSWNGFGLARCSRDRCSSMRDRHQEKRGTLYNPTLYTHNAPGLCHGCTRGGSGRPCGSARFSRLGPQSCRWFWGWQCGVCGARRVLSQVKIRRASQSNSTTIKHSPQQPTNAAPSKSAPAPPRRPCSIDDPRTPVSPPRAPATRTGL
jgi:hypothetical protein